LRTQVENINSVKKMFEGESLNDEATEAYAQYLALNEVEMNGGFHRLIIPSEEFIQKILDFSHRQKNSHLRKKGNRNSLTMNIRGLESLTEDLRKMAEESDGEIPTVCIIRPSSLN